MLKVGDGGVAAACQASCDSLQLKRRPSTGWDRQALDDDFGILSDFRPLPSLKILQLKCLGIKREPEDSSSKNDPFFFTPELANPC